MFNAGSGSIDTINEFNGNISSLQRLKISILKIDAEEGELKFVILKESGLPTSEPEYAGACLQKILFVDQGNGIHIEE